MSKALILVGMLALSQSYTLQANNYNCIRDLALGYLKGYSNDSTVVLPEECLSDATQAKLDNAIVGALLDLARDDKAAAWIEISAFINEFHSSISNCNLGEIFSNIDGNISKYGIIHVVQNFIVNYISSIEDLKEAYNDLGERKCEQAGEKFGEAFALMIPEVESQKIVTVVEAMLEKAYTH